MKGKEVEYQYEEEGSGVMVNGEEKRIIKVKSFSLSLTSL